MTKGHLPQSKIGSSRHLGSRRVQRSWTPGALHAPHGHGPDHNQASVCPEAGKRPLVMVLMSLPGLKTAPGIDTQEADTHPAPILSYFRTPHETKQASAAGTSEAGVRRDAGAQGHRALHASPGPVEVEPAFAQGQGLLQAAHQLPRGPLEHSFQQPQGHGVAGAPRVGERAAKSILRNTHLSNIGWFMCRVRTLGRVKVHVLRCLADQQAAPWAPGTQLIRVQGPWCRWCPPSG